VRCIRHRNCNRGFLEAGPAQVPTVGRNSKIEWHDEDNEHDIESEETRGDSKSRNEKGK
jgi:hypothetical protein